MKAKKRKINEDDGNRKKCCKVITYTINIKSIKRKFTDPLSEKADVNKKRNIEADPKKRKSEFLYSCFSKHLSLLECTSWGRETKLCTKQNSTVIRKVKKQKKKKSKKPQEECDDFSDSDERADEKDCGTCKYSDYGEPYKNLFEKEDDEGEHLRVISKSNEKFIDEIVQSGVPSDLWDDSTLVSLLGGKIECKEIAEGHEDINEIEEEEREAEGNEYDVIELCVTKPIEGDDSSSILETSEAEKQDGETESSHFKRLSKKLDYYCKFFPEQDNEFLISAAMEIKEMLKAVEGFSNFPEPNNVIEIMVTKLRKSVTKLIFKAVLAESAPEKNALNLLIDEIVYTSYCCLVYFYNSLLDSSSNLFDSILHALKKNSFRLLDPFILLIVLCFYPLGNCSLLFRYLTVCKSIFCKKNVNFPTIYTQNVTRFLLFTMVEKLSVNENSPTYNLNFEMELRRAAAKFYVDIIAKYFTESEISKIINLAKIIITKKSEFYQMFGALCAIRAMSPMIQAEVIPVILPFVMSKFYRYVSYRTENENNREIESPKTFKAPDNQEENLFAKDCRSLCEGIENLSVNDSEVENASDVREEASSQLESVENDDMSEETHENISDCSILVFEMLEGLQKQKVLNETEHQYAFKVREEVNAASSEHLIKYPMINRYSESLSYALSDSYESFKTDLRELLDHLSSSMSREKVYELTEPEMKRSGFNLFFCKN